MTIEELEAQAKAIKEQCSGWSHAHDGSYVACLTAVGYYKILDEIGKLKEELKKDEIL
jgi:hypothetical protein